MRVRSGRPFARKRPLRDSAQSMRELVRCVHMSAGMVSILIATADRAKHEAVFAEEIARGITDELGSRATIDFASMSSQRRNERHDIYVLGSALEHGRWLRDAESFVIKNRFVLSGRPVALFATVTASSDPYSIDCARRALTKNRADRFVTYQAPVRIAAGDLLGTALIGAEAVVDRSELALWSERLSAIVLKSRVITDDHLEACNRFGRELGARIYRDYLEPPFILDDVA